MRNIIFTLTLILTILTACEDKLDIVPKGQATLSTLDELEYLLNQEYQFTTPFEDLAYICNEACLYYGASTHISSVYSTPNTLAYAYLFYDESVDRATLATTDSRYNTIYRYINYMNVILDKIDEVEGDAARKEAIAAEAHIMRAYMHWLAVNIHARQYDESTADTEGGIAYVTDTDVSEQKTKQPLRQVYDNLLEDCAETYIEALPDEAPSVVRGGKAWGYAVRAKVLMQMKRYADALPMALKALEYNDNIEDRSSIIETGSWSLTADAPNNILYVSSNMIMPFMEVISPESVALFEEGDYVRTYDFMTWMDGESFSGVPGSAMCFAMGVWCNSFGITVERMHYLAAECYIRTGEIQEGLDLIDKVRQRRIDSDHYQPLSASTEAEAMALLQRAKWIECIGGYENFFDCKRWNSEEAYRRTITKQLPVGGDNVVTCTLTPDSPLWVLPFPSDAVNYNPSLTQNY